MSDKDEIRELELRRQHNERMRKAGEQFGKIIDRSGAAEKQEVASTIFGALRKKYGLEPEEEE